MRNSNSDFWNSALNHPPAEVKDSFIAISNLLCLRSRLGLIGFINFYLKGFISGLNGSVLGVGLLLCTIHRPHSLTPRTYDKSLTQSSPAKSILHTLTPLPYLNPMLKLMPRYIHTYITPLLPTAQSYTYTLLSLPFLHFPVSRVNK